MLLNNERSRLVTSPVPVQRSVRTHDLRVLTSMPAGRMVPLAVIPLLREDAITRGAARISFEMMETAEILLNAVNVTAKAYLVPKLAFERFVSMDDINRSYEGVARGEDDVIPWFESISSPAHEANEILTYMGKHFKASTANNINTDYIEAYNIIWNFRAKNRSPNITLRDRLDTDLAPAFWVHNNFKFIVPDFEQALIDGEVALQLAEGNFRAPVATDAAGGAEVSVQWPTTSDATFFKLNSAGSFAVQSGVAGTDANKLYANLNAVFDEMAAGGLRVTLSNIELARRTQAFAQLRRQFSGHSDEWIIDLLMDGIQIPDQAFKHPMLLAEGSTVFGMSKRYASDAGNLTESVVNGMTAIDLRWACPKINPGGVVMIVAEVTPEQLYERQRDVYLHAQHVAQLPQFLRDTLDPEKVTMVSNGYVDTDHSTASGVFGYAPLNFEWANNPPQVGGKFYRPEVNTAFDEDRQRIWAVEVVDPVLSEDFYLTTTMHTKPFVVTDADPFEAVVRGACIITGNTVFGPQLLESTSDYAEVLEEAPLERIDQTP